MTLSLFMTKTNSPPIQLQVHHKDQEEIIRPKPDNPNPSSPEPNAPTPEYPPDDPNHPIPPYSPPANPPTRLSVRKEIP